MKTMDLSGRILSQNKQLNSLATCFWHESQNKKLHEKLNEKNNLREVKSPSYTNYLSASVVNCHVRICSFALSQCLHLSAR